MCERTTGRGTWWWPCKLDRICQEVTEMWHWIQPFFPSRFPFHICRNDPSFGVGITMVCNHISTISIHRNILLTIFYHHISWYPNNDLIVGSYPIWILKESSRFFVSIHFTGSIHCFNWLDPSCLLATPVWVCRKVQWWVVGVPPKFIVDHLFSYSTGNLGVYPFLDAHPLEYIHRSLPIQFYPHPLSTVKTSNLVLSQESCSSALTGWSFPKDLIIISPSFQPIGLIDPAPFHTPIALW